MLRLALLLCACCAAVAAAGCGSDRPTRGEGTVDVVATVAPLASIAQNAGGRRARVETLVPAGADPHEWRPAPADLAALREADLVIRVGGGLDRWAAESGSEHELALLPRVDPLGADPHWWQDPVRVQRAAKEIRNELARADVDGAGYYEAATADFLERVRRLHHDVRTCISLLSRPGTPLAAQHDGFAYFNDRYGTAIVGPRSRGAKVGRRLWADALAEPGRPGDTYLGAVGANTETLVEALSRGAETCRPRP